jgi:spore germination cell wall hydrolase CwlJ-like protein
MKSIKRAAPWGAGIILLIIILLSTIGIYKYTNLKKTNESLQLTVEEQLKTIETLTKENTKLKADISELENKTSELENKVSALEKQITNQKSLASNKQNSANSSKEKRNYNATLNDRETLARLVFLEANMESLECQKAIASVIINRVNSGYWGNTVNSVIYAKNQFTPASRIPYTTPTATNYEAVDYVLNNGATLPSYVLYFRAGYHFSWSGYVPYKSIGNTCFGYMVKDKK